MFLPLDLLCEQWFSCSTRVRTASGAGRIAAHWSLARPAERGAEALLLLRPSVLFGLQTLVDCHPLGLQRRVLMLALRLLQGRLGFVTALSRLPTPRAASSLRRFGFGPLPLLLQRRRAPLFRRSQEPRFRGLVVRLRVRGKLLPIQTRAQLGVFGEAARAGPSLQNPRQASTWSQRSPLDRRSVP